MTDVAEKPDKKAAKKAAKQAQADIAANAHKLYRACQMAVKYITAIGGDYGVAVVLPTLEDAIEKWEQGKKP